MVRELTMRDLMVRDLAHTSSTTEQSSFGPVSIAIAALLWVLCFLVLYKHCRGRQLVHRERGEALAVKTQTTRERYEDIEKWLINKRVERHDILCQRILDHQQRLASGQTGLIPKENVDPTIRSGGEDATPANKLIIHRNWSVDTAESTDEENPSQAGFDPEDNDSQVEVDQDCPICYDAIVPDDLVSWSPNPSCEHVFHHRCIKEWLLQHSECPYCREVFLPIDSNEDLEQACDEQVRQPEPEACQPMDCYYCVQHGIVRPPATLPSFEARIEWERMQARARECPDRYELTKLRGAKETEDEGSDMEEGVDINSGIPIITPSMTRRQPVAQEVETPLVSVVPATLLVGDTQLVEASQKNAVAEVGGKNMDGSNESRQDTFNGRERCIESRNDVPATPEIDAMPTATPENRVINDDSTFVDLDEVYATSARLRKSNDELRKVCHQEPASWQEEGAASVTTCCVALAADDDSAFLDEEADSQTEGLGVLAAVLPLD